ncbi:MAG: hypothetical protein WBX25_20230 [Rhodomicrobium sp.]
MAEHPPEHWAKLAAEIREQAREMRDRVIRAELERLAKGYDRLAQYAAKRPGPNGYRKK